jgi:hypothetical protein
VGLAVLPFSATWEVFKVSPFLCFLTGQTTIETFLISADGSEYTECLQTQYSLRTARDQRTYAMNSMQSPPYSISFYLYTLTDEEFLNVKRNPALNLNIIYI